MIFPFYVTIFKSLHGKGEFRWCGVHKVNNRTLETELFGVISYQIARFL